MLGDKVESSERGKLHSFLAYLIAAGRCVRMAWGDKVERARRQASFVLPLPTRKDLKSECP